MERVYVGNEHGLEMFTISQFLTNEECDHIVRLTENGAFDQALPVMEHSL